MKSFVTISLAALATASVLPRDAASIISNLNGLADQLNSLDTAVKGFSGDNTAALAIQNSAMDLESALEDTTSDVQSSDPLTVEESGNVATIILGLTDPISTTLGDLVDSQAALESALPGASQIVLGDLNNLKSDVDALGAALVDKLSPAVAALAPQVLGSIDSAFDSAISAYQNAAPATSAPSGPDSSATPSATPSADSSVAPSATPSADSSVAPSATPSGETSATPSASPSGEQSAAPTAEHSSAAGSTKATPIATSKPSSTSTPVQYTGAASTVGSTFTLGSAMVMIFGFFL